MSTSSHSRHTRTCRCGSAAARALARSRRSPGGSARADRARHIAPRCSALSADRRPRLFDEGADCRRFELDEPVGVGSSRAERDVPPRRPLVLGDLAERSRSVKTSPFRRRTLARRIRRVLEAPPCRAGSGSSTSAGGRRRRPVTETARTLVARKPHDRITSSIHGHAASRQEGDERAIDSVTTAGTRASVAADACRPHRPDHAA